MAGWVRKRFSAAREKELSRATSRKVSSWSKSIEQQFALSIQPFEAIAESGMNLQWLNAKCQMLMLAFFSQSKPLKQSLFPEITRVYRRHKNYQFPICRNQPLDCRVLYNARDCSRRAISP